MVFAQKVLALGPGICPKATFGWRLFQSALSGSLFFIPPALPEVMIMVSPELTLPRGSIGCRLGNSKFPGEDGPPLKALGCLI